MTQQRLKLGAAGEQIAADHLVRLGFTILDRNYRAKFGELDIVVHSRQSLVFVEVKTRTRTGYDLSPMLSIGPHKRVQVRKLAQQWLMAHPRHPRAEELRFDAIAVRLDPDGSFVDLEHLEGAF